MKKKTTTRKTGGIDLQRLKESLKKVSKERWLAPQTGPVLATRQKVIAKPEK